MNPKPITKEQWDALHEMTWKGAELRIVEDFYVYELVLSPIISHTHGTTKFRYILRSTEFEYIIEETGTLNDTAREVLRKMYSYQQKYLPKPHKAPKP